MSSTPSESDATPDLAPRDWLEWHRPYDDPNSRLARRLAIVQQRIREALDAARPGPLTVISMCAGQGRDLLPVLAEHPRRSDVRALLVELDERNAAIARKAAEEGTLERVAIRCADAALTENYADYVPADLILACGIFGNITLADIERTVRALPSLAARGATVLWTRGRWKDDDPTPQIRKWIAEAGFDEIAFHGPADETYTVGANRFRSKTAPLETGARLFTFFR
jgi:hypothetical protein